MGGFQARSDGRMVSTQRGITDQSRKVNDEDETRIYGLDKDNGN